MKRKTTLAPSTAHLKGPGKLKITNGRLCYAAVEGRPQRFDSQYLQRIVCYGGVTVSDEAIRRILRDHVDCVFMDSWGMKFYGRLQGTKTDSTLLRIHQAHAMTDHAECLSIAKFIVSVKVDSQIAAAKYYYKKTRGLGSAVRQLEHASRQISGATCVATLRGLEGSATRAWFGILRRSLPQAWGFESRNRRPPRDPANALLSLGYTWLKNRVKGTLLRHGFEINLGAFHEWRAGRPSLVCDIMEPMRVPAVDRWLINVAGRKMLKPEAFIRTDDAGVRLPHGQFNSVLSSWEEHWNRGHLDEELKEVIHWVASRVRKYPVKMLQFPYGEV